MGNGLESEKRGTLVLTFRHVIDRHILPTGHSILFHRHRCGSLTHSRNRVPSFLHGDERLLELAEIERDDEACGTPIETEQTSKEHQLDTADHSHASR
ncbi:hypothetical protein Vi05172_g5233 [Venturia inaequalis]|nr:hypothetical protein Vi05172_g5233 [Venturia inaequalis]